MRLRECCGAGNPPAKHMRQPANPSPPSGQMWEATADQCAGKESFSREVNLNEIIHERFLAPALRPASASRFRLPATMPARSTPAPKNVRETRAPLSWRPAETPRVHRARQSISHV